MSVNRLTVATLCGAACILSLCGAALGEQWHEFHREKWHYKSAKLKKKLQVVNIHYYDADSLRRSDEGDVSLWVKELSKNDRYYVGKGEPAQETIYKNVRIRCPLKKYEILTEDGVEFESLDSMSEAIAPGSVYDKLHAIVCNSGK